MLKNVADVPIFGTSATLGTASSVQGIYSSGDSTKVTEPEVEEFWMRPEMVRRHLPSMYSMTASSDSKVKPFGRCSQD